MQDKTIPRNQAYWHVPGLKTHTCYPHILMYMCMSVVYVLTHA